MRGAVRSRTLPIRGQSRLTASLQNQQKFASRGVPNVPWKGARRPAAHGVARLRYAAASVTLCLTL